MSSSAGNKEEENRSQVKVVLELVSCRMKSDGFAATQGHKHIFALAAPQTLHRSRGGVDGLSRIPNTSIISSELYARIKEEWTKDKELQAIISKLQQGSASAKHYSWTANQLLRKGKLVIGKDNDLRKALLRHFHSEGQGGHSGVQATLKKIAAYVYWKKIRKEVKMFVKNCNVCQIFKPELVPYPGLLQPLPIPNQIWTEISMDFVDSLPMSKGKSVIMVVVDRLMFGQPPPAHITYCHGESPLKTVDRSLVAREAAIDLLIIDVTLKEMMKLEYIHEDGDVFVDYSWEIALSIDGDVYPEWCLEFFSTMYFEKDMDMSNLMKEKCIWFGLCG
ncbi:retrovirus-related pol polyprotein from transposon 17.6, partial [Tanacetum coccineum]